ncbi:MAG: EipA family protein [Rhizomicrobium sp.]
MTCDVSGFLGAVFAAFAALALSTAPTAADNANDDTFSPNEIVRAGSDFFGVTTEVMAKAVQRVTEDLGLPDGYIRGDEGSGAFILGVRYGSGWLIRKGVEPTKVYWKGPPSASTSAATAPRSSRWSTISRRSAVSISASRASRAAFISSPASA